MAAQGALAHLGVVEVGGIGPAPFAAMMLADHGAEVVRIERPGQRFDSTEILNRSRTRMALDLKSEEGVAAVCGEIRYADGLIEASRPGVMERLGVGPDALMLDNPRPLFGRMTGWGQDCPLASRAGRGINYIVLVGVPQEPGTLSLEEQSV